MHRIPFIDSNSRFNMNIRRVGTQNVILFCIISCLCIYYVYQYFKIEELMENIGEYDIYSTFINSIECSHDIYLYTMDLPCIESFTFNGRPHVPPSALLHARAGT